LRQICPDVNPALFAAVHRYNRTSMSGRWNDGQQCCGYWPTRIHSRHTCSECR